MWTRAELKSRAKDLMRKKYWNIFLVCLIAMFFGALSGSRGRADSNSAVTARSDSDSYDVTIHFGPGNRFPLYSFGGGRPSYIPESRWESAKTGERILYVLSREGLDILSFALFHIVFWLLLIGSILFSVFFSNVLIVGLCRYLMIAQQTGETPPVSTLFWGFRCGHYMNLVKIMFLQHLYIFLWSLLFVIPGMVKSFEYFSIPYILAENPDMSSADIFEMSHEMMYGQKWDLFVLNLSFIGWYFLGSLLFGIGHIFVVPYEELTNAELYGVLRSGRPELNGFGPH